MTNHAIRQQVEQLLPEKRFNHTLRVAETAVALAEKYGESTEKTECAALLHDVAKFFDKDRMEEIILKESNIPDDYLKYPISIWHAPVGAVYARDHFQITDQDILNAISYHTTGRPEMSLLEKIIFVADYIEPGRSFPGVEETREAAQEDLDRAVALALRNTVVFLASRAARIYPDTIHAYNAFCIKLGG
ncbi:bis(5'-nucleosyl)-tetraphosphatase (symmetrical) YqeK [Pullulanibacillus sp. KACC 23026]|uniref:bis(5'-nucleosyl)-tetraphosphatase (symmetrical) YqeK n=1 Tax=Pullulanibacillus sp. KACC 23026 TaxID=3028315 RepID=UPI0023AEB86D|nr:bis(5'-nucleosyl)-tetraphosphatase (symmetrical) YqeK [Pullulanibacillus sp. KACC 23026]WEG14205.1 bis(5'-nucleosyl)-tetraphosphatase (symmetrical) YqeK [Pullulanibacillus sp. KACC 23026]